jgi:(aminoalkyl)phosphonate N-acetyltransferase
MEKNLRIRKIEISDLEFVYNAVCNLENEILEKVTFQKIFYENITNPNFLYLIALNNSNKVGFISFHTQNLLHHCGLVGEIQEFYLVSEYRGNGIGKKLIEGVFNFAKEKKIKSIEVTTNMKRTENIEIYKNLGFNLSHHKFTI